MGLGFHDTCSIINENNWYERWNAAKPRQRSHVRSYYVKIARWSRGPTSPLQLKRCKILTGHSESRQIQGRSVSNVFWIWFQILIVAGLLGDEATAVSKCGHTVAVLCGGLNIPWRFCTYRRAHDLMKELFNKTGSVHG